MAKSSFCRSRWLWSCSWFTRWKIIIAIVGIDDLVVWRYQCRVIEKCFKFIEAIDSNDSRIILACVQMLLHLCTQLFFGVMKKMMKKFAKFNCNEWHCFCRNGLQEIILFFKYSHLQYFPTIGDKKAIFPFHCASLFPRKKRARKIGDIKVLGKLVTDCRGNERIEKGNVKSAGSLGFFRWRMKNYNAEYSRRLMVSCLLLGDKIPSLVDGLTLTLYRTISVFFCKVFRIQWTSSVNSSTDR